MNIRCLKYLLFSWLVCFGVVDAGAAEQGEPARLLVVTVTKGFRHSSIETAEPVLEKLGREQGLFHVDFLRMPPNRPPQPRRPRRGKNVTDEKWAQIEAELKDKQRAFQKADQPWQETLKQKFEVAFSPESLAQFDAVVFVSTTGELPIPDLGAFLKWIQEGHAFIGVHAASDTLKSSDAYVEMIGGHFAGHPWTAGGEHGFVNHDPKHRIVQMFPERFRWKDEIYQYDPRYKPENVRVLLSIDMAASNPKHPWHVPVSWIRDYGRGRVFYTNLGHNDATWGDAAFQKHFTEGTAWALEKFDAASKANPSVQAAEYLRSAVAAAGELEGIEHDRLRAQVDAKIAADPSWAVQMRPQLVALRSLNGEKMSTALKQFVEDIQRD
ncbi:MAG: ThuA domain-containing protein [Planctomycetaceae bacterium]|nr:ThuA domain-containing protein [Planctomycetaceae bacterium]